MSANNEVTSSSHLHEKEVPEASPSYRCGSQGTERFSNSPQATRRISTGARIKPGQSTWESVAYLVLSSASWGQSPGPFRWRQRRRSGRSTAGLGQRRNEDGAQARRESEGPGASGTSVKVVSGLLEETLDKPSLSSLRLRFLAVTWERGPVPLARREDGRTDRQQGPQLVFVGARRCRGAVQSRPPGSPMRGKALCVCVCGGGVA